MLVFVGMMISGVGGYFTLQTRNEELERRVLNLEKDLVPRSEHMLRDQELNKRLDQIQEDIKDVKTRVEIIDNRERSVRH